MGQTRFGHVTFPQSHASEVLESWFVTDTGTLDGEGKLERVVLSA